MKITFDTSAFWESGLTYEEIYHTVAEAGFKYVSPYNQDFPGFWRRPKFTMKEVEWHKRIELNVWYVDHVSFWLDVKIFFLTIFKVLRNSDNANVGETVRNDNPSSTEEASEEVPNPVAEEVMH